MAKRVITIEIQKTFPMLDDEEASEAQLERILGQFERKGWLVNLVSDEEEEYGEEE
jgi:hypothetical protein